MIGDSLELGMLGVQSFIQSLLREIVEGLSDEVVRMQLCDEGFWVGSQV